MCVNHKVKTKSSTSTEVNQGCKILSKDHKHPFCKNLEGFTSPTNEGCGSAGGGVVVIGSASSGGGNAATGNDSIEFRIKNGVVLG
eukprot:1639046-Ditylum_brightwellii.AAC.1